ncbi:hypothetical protein [Flavobacterium algicola]|uniref:hypothetical protein n=1 Tax=Flavobacterium algicola TaxID=556529 RepID=UPI001EFDB19E|nr:hypothetical protein [Flavobacterium algicola]MCG9791868.1 hypothetical protein [Flavobacterium algicola]
MAQDREFPPAFRVKKSRGQSIAIWILSILLLLTTTAFYFYHQHVTEQFSAYNQTNEDTSATNGMASMSDLNHWRNATFTIPEYDDIPENFQRSIVKIFIDNGYYNGDDQANYFFTKIPDRAKGVFAYGYFTGGNEIEMAFLLEKQDFESSSLFIIASNGDLLYWKEISSELPTINSFKQGAKIYTDEMVLKPSKLDGLIANNKGTKYAYVYNQKAKTFDKYYQYTEAEIRASKENFELAESNEDEYVE